LVPVWRGLLERVDGDDAVAARPRIDDHRLAPRLREPLGDHTEVNFRREPRGEHRHDAHRLRWKRLRERARSCEQRQYGECEAPHTEALKVSGRASSASATASDQVDATLFG